MSNRDHAAVFVPPPLLYAVPLLIAAWLHTKRPWALVDAPVLLAVTGLMIIVSGIAIGLASVYSFRAADTTILPAGRPTTAIVESGPYRFTRNPMYVAMSCAYLGLAFIFNNAWAIALLPLVVAVVDGSVIRREEQYLTAKFGEPYRGYCRRVRRWL